MSAREPRMTWRGAYAALALSLAIVAATNRHGSIPDPSAAPADAYSYWALADAAPALPGEALAFHHTQRIAIPYALGLAHDATGIPLHGLFQMAVSLLAIATLAVVLATLRSLGVPPLAAALVGAALAFNPWVFRPSFAFPEMVADLGFVFGVAVAARGLLGGGAAGVLIGQFVASASRQTGVMLVPVIALWLWRDRAVWARVPATARLAVVLGAAGTAGAVYLATWRIALPIAEPAENLDHLTGLATWLATAFDPAVLAVFGARAVVPLLVPLGLLVLAGRFRRTRKAGSDAVPLLVAASVCLGLQPILAGPELTGGNAPRLVTIGLSPLYLAAGIALRDAGALVTAESSGRALMAGLVLAVASLHHWYALSATPAIGQQLFFAATYALGCVGVVAIVAADLRRGGKIGAG